MVTPTAAEVFRDYATVGVVDGIAHKVIKAQARAWGTNLESQVATALTTTALAFPGRVQLYAELDYPVWTRAEVRGDATVAYNGIYTKLGASGAGSWFRIADLPDGIVRLLVTGGSPNAVQASAYPQVPAQPGSKLYFFTPTDANTGPVTLAIDGGTPVALKTMFGDPLAADALVEDIVTPVVWVIDHYRLLQPSPTDSDATLVAVLAAQTAAELAEANAETARDAAISAAGQSLLMHASRTSFATVTVLAAIKAIVTFGRAAAGDGGGAPYVRATSEPAHEFKIRTVDRFLPDGTTSAPNGGWWAAEEETPLKPRMIGDPGSGDWTTVLKQTFEAAALLHSEVHIPKRAARYMVDGADEIIVKNTLRMRGAQFDTPKDNHACLFRVSRDAAGTSVDPTGWSTSELVRGHVALGAMDALGKNVHFQSSEILMERVGSGGAFYVKTEMVNVAYADGSISTPLCHTYVSAGTITATAHDPSLPITLDGFNLARSGLVSGTETLLGSLIIERDNVTVDDMSIVNDEPDDPIAVACDVHRSVNVVFNRPYVRGYDYADLGYGIAAYATLNLAINIGDMHDCRHAVTGRNNADLKVLGGSYGYSIDDHWGDRMVLRDLSIICKTGTAAVSFSGYNIIVSNVHQTNGRTTLAIRTDTPNLGGQVLLEDIQVYSRGEADTFWSFGFTSQDGPGTISETFTNKPTLPDLIIVRNIKIDVNTVLRYAMWLGIIKKVHTAWGTVELSGLNEFNSTTHGIYVQKDDRYWDDRSPHFTINTSSDFKTGKALWVHSETGDTGQSRAASADIDRVRNAGIRFSALGLLTLDVGSEATLIIVDDDDATETSFGSAVYNFNGTKFGAGQINLPEKCAFFGARFAGNLTDFPATATLQACVRGSGITGLPVNITSAVASPYTM